MQRTINVHFLPELVEPEQLAGRVVVVIDVLRATTTIAYALAAGASCVVPCLEVEDAREWLTDDETVLLGGERGGLKIEGFHLGNSPDEYVPQLVAGRKIVFTTTNGTRALRRAERAARILLAGFVNFSTVCDRLAQESTIEIVCAGTKRQITREDVLLAGAIAVELGQPASTTLNDQAAIACDAWRRFIHDLATQRRPLHETLRDSLGARNLIDIGQERDIEIAAQLDALVVVPELDLATWQIVAR